MAQLLGAWMGGLLIYANYYHAIKIVDPNLTRATASLFTTYALDYLPSGADLFIFLLNLYGLPDLISLCNFFFNITIAACFFSEFLGTAILLIGVLAVTDKSNGPPPAGLLPLALFILILGEGAALGMQTAYALNPVCLINSTLCTCFVYILIFPLLHHYFLSGP